MRGLRGVGRGLQRQVDRQIAPLPGPPQDLRGHLARRDGHQIGHRHDHPLCDPQICHALPSSVQVQRDALDHAQVALKKLAAMAHGEVLTQLLGAWESRDAQSLPTAQSLGRAVSAGVRGAWVQSLSQQVVADVSAARTPS